MKKRDGDVHKGSRQPPPESSVANLLAEAAAFLGSDAQFVFREEDGLLGRSRKRVLLAYGGEEQERRVFEVLADILVGLAEEVRVLHLRQEEISRGARFSLESEREAEKVTVAAVSRLQCRHVRALGVVRTAPHALFARAIVQEAEVYGAASIVMVSRARSSLSQVVWGSICRGVMRRARCPVITVSSPRRSAGKERAGVTEELASGPRAG